MPLIFNINVLNFQNENSNEEPKMADPSEPIPMPFSYKNNIKELKKKRDRTGKTLCEEKPEE